MVKITLHVNSPGSMGSNPPRRGPTSFTMSNTPTTAATPSTAPNPAGSMGSNPPRRGPTSFTMTNTPTNAAAPSIAPASHSIGAGPSKLPTTEPPPMLGNHVVSAAPLGPNPFRKALAGAPPFDPESFNGSNSSATPTTARPTMMGNHAVQAAPQTAQNSENTAEISAPVRPGQVNLNARDPFKLAMAAPLHPAVVPPASIASTSCIVPATASSPIIQTSTYFTPTTAVVGFVSQDCQSTLECLKLANSNPGHWEALVGLYLQNSGRTPFQVGCLGGQNDWVLCNRKLDKLERNEANDIDRWLEPPQNSLLMQLCQQVESGNQLVFERAIREWAVNADPRWVALILKKAGWRKASVWGSDNSADWQVMDDILKMPDGEERSRLMARAKQESPRFFEECERNIFCGMRKYMMQHIPTEGDDRDIEYDQEYEVRAIRVPGSKDRQEHPISLPKKRKTNFKMASGPGQPTQFHGVPLEERAIDSKGNRLPWSLEYHEDHPNARGQRRHAEEKGPFGKSTRRKGSSRTRTATPAKKENPTLDGFEKALKHDAQLAAEQQEAKVSVRAQNDGNTAARNAPPHTKEPTQIMIYGYAPSRCYAAIDLYEKISGGMICEDYPREPPSELRKYQTPFSASRSVQSRARTKQEIALANRYAGGNSWIKLTCDSAEAATRAVELSPRQVYGHWVYAELYNGKGPDFDKPIPITEDDRREGPFNSPRPPRKPSQTLSAAFSQHDIIQKRATSTLPRNFTSQADSQSAHDADSPSPSTVSSATATGPEYPNLRNRHQSQAEQSTANSSSHEIAPGIPRYVLRPASEAFLPQPTWWERQIQWLGARGLIPTDFIGNGLPILENGEFDWANASWYWRICYWFDSHVGTDICGLEEN